MKRLVVIMLVISLTVTLAFVQKGGIPAVKASSVYQGDLILTGNNVTVIEGQFDVNGSIIVEENATLILRNAVINFTQKHWKQFNLTLRNPVNGHPRLQVSYATITSTPDFQFEICLRGNSTAETYQLYVHNKIIAYDASFANITGSLHIWYVECRDSSTVNISDSEIWYVKPYDSSVLSVFDSEVKMAMENYGASTTSASNCTIGFLGTYGSSVTTLSKCNITNAHPQGGTSSSVTISDSEIELFNVAASCPISLQNCRISSFDAFGSSTVSLSNCHAEGMYVYSSSVVTVSDQIIVNGSIVVEGNASLILRNAVVNFTQSAPNQFNMTFRNPANGNPRLIVQNATITSNNYLKLYFYRNSSASINELRTEGMIYLMTLESSVVSASNSEWIQYVNSFDHSIFNMANSFSFAVHAKDNSSVNILNCTLNVLTARSQSSVNMSNSVVNSYIVSYADSKIHVYDSTTNTSYSYDNSRMWVVNSTSSYSFIYNQSEVYVYWYLDIHVIDSIGQDVPSAFVRTFYPSEPGLTIVSGFTDACGSVRLALPEKIMNATGEYPVGNYTVEATYDIYSDETTVNMTGNQQTVLTLEDFIVPEFSSATIILLGLMLTTFVAVIRKKRFLVIK